MKIRPVILCGGAGTRLWPNAKKHQAKQFIDFGNWTLLGKTLERVKASIYDAPIISTNAKYLKQVKQHLKKHKIRKFKIVLEPAKRNTAPAILSTALIKDIPNEQPLMFLAADHLIEKVGFFNKAINKLRASGYTILSANYTVASPGKSPFPYCIQDCFHMIQWIEKNAETKAWDLFNFGVIGESAGGHLALMTGFTSPKDFSLKIEVRKPKYIVDLYGPNNMFEMFLYHSDSSTIRKMSFFSKFIFKHADLTKKLLEFDPMSNLKKVQEITELFSPINYLSSFAPPTLIIHGTADEAVPVSQSKNLKFKLDQLNVPNDILLLEGVNHGFWGASSEQREAVQNKISNFIMNQYQKN